MNCSFTSPQYDRGDLIVYWLKIESGDSEKVAYSFYHGREQRDKVHTDFQNRTRALWHGHHLGDCSLIVKRITVWDAGMYRVYVKTGPEYRERESRLQVAAPYTRPVLALTTECSRNDSIVHWFTCVVSGGYPEADVQWWTELGENLSAHAHTQSRTDKDGLFRISSELAVTHTSGQRYVCTVINPLLQHQLNSSKTLPGIYPEGDSETQGQHRALPGTGT
ncbi:hypothetical protein chiPu_0028639, partial [Chiloscyllium punctatum]|nr:hypothetical protein [Chiloscyllium punctatum]